MATFFLFDFIITNTLLIGCSVEISALTINNSPKVRSRNNNNNVAFTAEGPPVYAVKNMTVFKKAIPIISFIGACMAASGYAVGSFGLFYDLAESKKRGLVAPEQKEGAKTITPNTQLGKTCMKLCKIGLFGSSLSGITCGIGEGLPIMTIGNITESTSVPIIETPIGTGLFGLAIACIFAALALDNTPELKLNHFRMMAKDKASDKAKMVMQNIGVALKEIFISLNEIRKNFFKKGFLKEAFFQGHPNTVVFQESINKEGKVILKKMLRHNRNYMMHTASFILGVGGISLAITKAVEWKSAQRHCLRVEEGGFLLDNFGMTRYGIDKFTTGGKAAGANFAIGGVINAISQFMGLDNQDGRAMQWLGIALVFVGYMIDRGKFMNQFLKTCKHRPELTDVVREWKFDLSKLIKDKKELKKLLDQINRGEPITSEQFQKLEEAVRKATGAENHGLFRTDAQVRKDLETALGKEVSDIFSTHKIADAEETKDVLGICTEKIFGSRNPEAVIVEDKK